MAALTIRNVDDAIKTALRLRAAQRGVSMEEEARTILRQVLSPSRSMQPMGRRLLARFSKVSQEDFVLPVRQEPRDPPEWGDD